MDRRTFLLGASGAAAATQVAAAKGRSAARGGIEDIEHVVILMQENRSFDHYFGMLRGVRGFADPRPAILPGGHPVWAQRKADRDGGEIAWPFRLDTHATAAGCFGGLDHSWKDSQIRWQNWDVWADQKGPQTMGYMTREDLPFYYALADAFTICDAYHCSLQGPTGPNRLYHFSGTSGLSLGLDGEYAVTNGGCDDNPGADMAKDDPRFPGLPWKSFAGRLEEAGVSWRIYQEYANFSDNPLGSFVEFRNLDRASSRYRRGRAWVEGSTPENAETSRAHHLIEAFAADVAADRLPAISWIVPQMQMSEHPDAPPAYGQMLTGALIAALAANPKVWAKTVFILNYDENDGYFDHMVPPMAATQPHFGASTVSLRGEEYKGVPVGLGPRVPMLIVSPWTRGGWINSQLFDHTSVLRFLERRFGIAEPNISPWRRSVCGDLVTAFDFDVSHDERHDMSWFTNLPSVRHYLDESDAICRTAPKPTIGGSHGVPSAETGTRPARALPYDLDVLPNWTPEGMALRFVNRSPVGVVFAVQDQISFPGWRHYTVGAQASLDAVWAIAEGEPHALVVTGPNGFYREYRGDAHKPRIESGMHWAQGDSAILLTLAHKSGGAIPVTVHCRHTGAKQELLVTADGGQRLSVPLSAAHRWYDLGITGPGLSQRLCGHLENGAPDISEPVPA
ncbi:phosphocholine-specific phospholipase C [Sphingomonas sp. PR090111-T3T-6A]|uniref:phosphocholine-specific phospholipase C n=1 Tax=Sphingomonas sp. PR090111-T3T-6A TaxID=685778 RepID=UPI0003819320|nr:phospholipase C, phosphocholine-specific [Sphingomonas sp. PR090111-T3T-6A]